MRSPADTLSAKRRTTTKWLGVAALVVTAVIGFVGLGAVRATPAAVCASEVRAAAVPAVTTQPVGDSARVLAAVREPAPLPFLDAFDEQHKEAVRQVFEDERTHGGMARVVFGQNRTAVVECLVMDVGPVNARSGTAWVTLMCRETNAAKGTKHGDRIEAWHNPADELRTLHVDTGYERLRPGEVRACLLQKQWGKTALRILGRATGRLDFAAMRNACDWPNGREWICKEGCSVLEGRLTRTAPSKLAAQRGREESLLTIERVHWSSAGWLPEEVHHVNHWRDVADLVAEDDVSVDALEIRTASDPPQGVTVMLVVHHGWPLYDLVLSARVR